MSPFDYTYWEDEYQKHLKNHKRISDQIFFIIIVFIFIVGILIGRFG
jgi:ABC-type lipoprotein release transport system permease subunit